MPAITLRPTPKKLIQRLDSTAMMALERAVGEANRLGVLEVGPELMVIELLAGGTSGASRLVEAAGSSCDELLEPLRSAVATTATTPGRRPIFAASLFDWFTDAWLLASIELGESKIEAAHLTFLWLTRARSYAAPDVETPQLPGAESLQGRLAEFRDSGAAPARTPTTPSLLERVEELERRLASLEATSSARNRDLDRRLATLETDVDAS
ncbi:hypothetical protein [Paraliomyxa miuraensis]|uniref:hypothetical protein n=1 Tax=Paraliomyxa miuraensis TaxID=376150 RepID=UPI00225C37BF|nr:hypothetical protein [Paraliomyxa miuraensis]MCX4240748.1 hypothetical protein [Paraliomyxa miuraensis]